MCTRSYPITPNATELERVIPVISSIARSTLVSGLTVMSLFCMQRTVYNVEVTSILTPTYNLYIKTAVDLPNSEADEGALGTVGKPSTRGRAH